MRPTWFILVILAGLLCLAVARAQNQKLDDGGKSPARPAARGETKAPVQGKSPVSAAKSDGAKSDRAAEAAIADHAIDRRVGIGVDREHRARGAHADRVVELAARADADEQPRRDRPPGDPDLP